MLALGGAFPGGGVPAPGGTCSEGGCLLLVGVPGPGGYLLWGGCLVENPPMATAADSTHPTGMHSCY